MNEDRHRRVRTAYIAYFTDLVDGVTAQQAAAEFDAWYTATIKTAELRGYSMRGSTV